MEKAFTKCSVCNQLIHQQSFDQHMRQHNSAVSLHSASSRSLPVQNPVSKANTRPNNVTVTHHKPRHNPSLVTPAKSVGVKPSQPKPGSTNPTPAANMKAAATGSSKPSKAAQAQWREPLQNVQQSTTNCNPSATSVPQPAATNAVKAESTKSATSVKQQVTSQTVTTSTPVATQIPKPVTQVPKPATHKQSATTEPLGVATNPKTTITSAKCTQETTGTSKKNVPVTTTVSPDQVNKPHLFIMDLLDMVESEEDKLSCGVCTEVSISNTCFGVAGYLEHISTSQHMQNVFKWLLRVDISCASKYQTLIRKLKEAKKDAGLFCEFCRKASFNTKDLSAFAAHLKTSKHLDNVSNVKKKYEKRILSEDQHVKAKAATPVSSTCRPSHITSGTPTADIKTADKLSTGQPAPAGNPVSIGIRNPTSTKVPSIRNVSPTSTAVSADPTVTASNLVSTSNTMSAGTTTVPITVPKLNSKPGAPSPRLSTGSSAKSAIAPKSIDLSDTGQISSGNQTITQPVKTTESQAVTVNPGKSDESLDKYGVASNQDEISTVKSISSPLTTQQSAQPDVATNIQNKATSPQSAVPAPQANASVSEAKDKVTASPNQLTKTELVSTNSPTCLNDSTTSNSEATLATETIKDVQLVTKSIPVQDTTNPSTNSKPVADKPSAENGNLINIVVSTNSPTPVAATIANSSIASKVSVTTLSTSNQSHSNKDDSKGSSSKFPTLPEGSSTHNQYHHHRSYSPRLVRSGNRSPSWSPDRAPPSPVNDEMFSTSAEQPIEISENENPQQSSRTASIGSGHSPHQSSHSRNSNRNESPSSQNCSNRSPHHHRKRSITPVRCKRSHSRSPNQNAKRHYSKRSRSKDLDRPRRRSRTRRSISRSRHPSPRSRRSTSRSRRSSPRSRRSTSRSRRSLPRLRRSTSKSRRSSPRPRRSTSRSRRPSPRSRRSTSRSRRSSPRSRQRRSSRSRSPYRRGQHLNSPDHPSRSQSPYQRRHRSISPYRASRHIDRSPRRPSRRTSRSPENSLNHRSRIQVQSSYNSSGDIHYSSIDRDNRIDARELIAAKKGERQSRGAHMDDYTNTGKRRQRIRPRPLSPLSADSLAFVIEKKWMSYAEKYYNTSNELDESECMFLQREYLQAYRGFFLDDPKFELTYQRLLKPEVLREKLSKNIDELSLGDDEVPVAEPDREPGELADDDPHTLLARRISAQPTKERKPSPKSVASPSSRVASTSQKSDTVSFDILKRMIREKLKIPTMEEKKITDIHVPDLVKQALETISENEARPNSSDQGASVDTLMSKDPFLGFVHSILSGILNITGLQDDVDKGSYEPSKLAELQAEQRRMHENMVTKNGHFLIKISRNCLTRPHLVQAKFPSISPEVISVLMNLDRDVLQLIADTPLLKS